MSLLLAITLVECRMVRETAIEALSAGDCLGSQQRQRRRARGDEKEEAGKERERERERVREGRHVRAAGRTPSISHTVNATTLSMARYGPWTYI